MNWEPSTNLFPHHLPSILPGVVDAGSLSGLWIWTSSAVACGTCVWIWTHSAVTGELVWTSSPSPSSSCSSSWCCWCGNEIFLDCCWIQNGSKQNGYYRIVVVVVVVVCWLSSKWLYVAAAAAGAHSLTCSPAKEQLENNWGQFSRASQGWMQPASQSIACWFENDKRWWYLQLGCSTIVEQGWRRHGYCLCIIRRANYEFLNAKLKDNGAGAQPILTSTTWKPRLETIQEVRALSRRRFHNFVRWRRSSHKSAQSLEVQKGILGSMAHTFWACKSHQFTSHVWCICWAPLVPCLWTQTLNSGPLPLLLQMQKLLACQVQYIQLEAIMTFKAPNHCMEWKGCPFLWKPMPIL
jgi:hypothetical protein